MDQAKQAILATLTYSDIFDYPLTHAELWRYLVTPKPILFTRFEKALLSLDTVNEKDRFYHLKGRQKLISERQKRTKISEKKLQRAKEIAKLLSFIPTIELISVSGSLAMHNADKNADIDLFIVTKAKTLWTTRLFIAFVLHTKHIRRKRKENSAPNRVCVNMFVDSDNLLFPKERRDSYTAHELLQMKPLFARAYTYHELLRKNNWVRQFLPNGFPESVLREIPATPKTKSSVISFIEPFARMIQVWYMHNHRTREAIHNGFVAFHPYEYREVVLKEWKRRQEKYGIHV